MKNLPLHKEADNFEESTSFRKDPAALLITCTINPSITDIFYKSCARLQMATGEGLVESAIYKILESVKTKRLKGEKRIRDEDLLALKLLCGPNLLPALDIVDKSGVELHTCPSGRTTYVVKGSSRNTYVCLRTANFCSCLSFQYTVLMRRDSVMCKHLLAVCVAEAIGSAVEQEVSDEDMAECLKVSVSSYLPTTESA